MTIIDTTTKVTITAPANVDGRGAVAVLNDPTDTTNFVGYLFKASGFGNSNIRTSKDPVVEGHGANFGSFYLDEGSFTLEVELAIASTAALSNARYEKLCKAVNALAANGVLSWEEPGGVPKYRTFRLEQGPSDPDPDTRRSLIGFVAEDPRIYGATTTAGPGTFTVGGIKGTPPVFTITSPTNTIVITRTSPTPSEALTLTGLSGVGTVTVNFSNKTVMAGGTNYAGAVDVPSKWWELQPGSNTVTVSGGTVSGSGISYNPAW